MLIKVFAVFTMDLEGNMTDLNRDVLICPSTIKYIEHTPVNEGGGANITFMDGHSMGINDTIDEVLSRHLHSK